MFLLCFLYAYSSFLNLISHFILLLYIFVLVVCHVMVAPLCYRGAPIAP